MPDFWLHSGYHLADRDAAGKLLVSDDLLRAWWARPEVMPVEESCAAERALHAALLAEPRRPVAAAELAAMQDPDARENYGVVLAFRERLLAAPTLEAAYLGLFRSGDVTAPPIFIDQLAHIIVRSILEGADDPLEARTAELFYREQKVTLQEGAVLLADAETVNLHASGGAYGNIGRLLVEAKTLAKSTDLDVLDRNNAATYWKRDEKHDTVVSFSHGRAALAAFCRVIEKWVGHFFGVAVTVTPLRAIEDERWFWHIGLDAEATSILNDLYRGEEPDAGRIRRILALFRLDFAEPSVLRPDVAGHPVYMACAMDTSNVLRIKPQNLLLNLPLAPVS
jgi:hypothetical protein